VTTESCLSTQRVAHRSINLLFRRVPVWPNFRRIAARCADREINIQTLPTVLNAFRIEGSCDAPETTKFSTGLQQCVYVANGYNIRTFACTPLYAPLMLLVHRILAPEKSLNQVLVATNLLKCSPPELSPWLKQVEGNIEILHECCFDKTEK